MPLQTFLEIISPKFASAADAELHLEQLSVLDSFAFGYVDSDRTRAVTYHYPPETLPSDLPTDVRAVPGLRRERVV